MMPPGCGVTEAAAVTDTKGCGWADVRAAVTAAAVGALAVGPTASETADAADDGPPEGSCTDARALSGPDVAGPELLV